ncbi:YqgQ family protein [Halobacillus kuroshimensis]|uniref:YqgQ family protein n=1 Tax=Halobacillus kuroshimensis TaxID=302481 RepID=A0ABS3DZ51_9BACI|nr:MULTISPECIES: YqgQ family protein [Halobacillus]MBN8236628.1 YqgQ family protein [Halobacillus kuroshimensis]
MKTIYDVQQFLKKFGTIIYIGDRTADLEMMEDEIRELYQSQCMTTEDFQMALLLLRSEIARERDRQEGDNRR